MESSVDDERAPAEATRADGQHETDSEHVHVWLRSRPGLALALTWVLACCALYAVEVLKLMNGLG
jgi:hypothetical protein